MRADELFRAAKTKNANRRRIDREELLFVVKQNTLASGFEQCTMLFLRLAKGLLNSLAFDGKGYLRSNKTQNLLFLFAVRLFVVVILHSHQAERLAAAAQKNSKPDGRWNATFFILKVGKFLERDEIALFSFARIESRIHEQ